MSNAAKHRKRAAEFEQLKQIDRAIASYIRAIEASESAGEDVDVVLLNKVGDLTLRQGRVADAVTYYERAVEHYAASGLFNNAIALCNKILRSAPGRANVYFTLGRICARKGLRGDATRNFLEYATRMQQEGRVDEGMRALAEVADLMPELTEIRRLVEEHATRVGIELPRRKTPPVVQAAENARAVIRSDDKSRDLVFLDLGVSVRTARNTPPLAPRIRTPPDAHPSTSRNDDRDGGGSLGMSLEDFMLFDPSVEPKVEPIVESLIEEGNASAPTLEGLDMLEGLEANGEFQAEAFTLLEGFTTEEAEPSPEAPVEQRDAGLTWVVSQDALDAVDESADLMTTAASADPIDREVDALPDLVIEDFDHVADDALEVPFRLDPHDFILPGELPPLLVDDALVDAGMSFDHGHVDVAIAQSSAVVVESVPVESLHDDVLHGAPPEGASRVGVGDANDPTVSGDARHAVDVDTADDAHAPLVTPRFVNEIAEPPEAIDPTTDDDGEDIEQALRESIEAHRAVRTTPSLPLAAVAAEANAVATTRWEELRLALAETPHDWALRRRLAESLFEVGEREAGLSELQTALSGFSHGGDLNAAADVADELIRISPERIQYHQKRVELAVRLSDPTRLRAAYLDLADTLVRASDDTRAHAVYARVLELDPWDERARAALGTAAPPPPPKPMPDEQLVSLADWLRDDEPGTARMRMREPVVSGDEQADFDSLLRHFKEGVSRSLGEEDYESHYDLGVAYKEMGLLDDAIEEFQKALRSRRHRLPAYEALGQCFVEQSRHAVAATVLTRALHEPGLGDAQRVGVLYLLAYSCEALQRADEARSYYSRVYATDIHFRDVAARLAALDLVAR